MALSLRWRLALGYALVLLFILVPLAIVQASAVHAQLLGATTTALKAAAAAGAGTAGKPSPRGDTRSSVEQVVDRAAGLNLAAAAVSSSGQVLGAAGPLQDTTLITSSLVLTPTVRQALADQQDNMPLSYQVSTARGPFLVALAPLHLPPQPGATPTTPATPRGKGAADPAKKTPDGVLLLAEGLTPIDTTAAGVWLLTLAGTGIALLLATALGALLVRRSLRPLTRVAAAAEAMAAGDYARRVAAPATRDEVGHLATAFNTMAAAVEEAFATQRRFVADAAHELRTPLTALGGYADVLLLGAAADPRELTAALEAMRGETQRMTRLVNDLLVLARLDAATPVAMQWAGVDLAALLRDAYNGVLLRHVDRHITLELPEGAGGPVITCGDPDRLRQVVANLVDNAIKFTLPGGHVVLALHAGVDAAILQVRDDGVGIAPADLPHLGERFYRADRARSRATGGTGLGLAIVQAIVAAHNGSFSIRSRLGQGTTVSVRLPRTAPYAEPTPLPLPLPSTPTVDGR